MTYLYLEAPFITPASITVNTGGTPVGTVSDVQTLQDGNVYQVPEVAGVPGFDIDFNFTNVGTIAGFVSHIWYAGSATHEVSLGIYNHDTSSNDPYLDVGHSTSLYSYRTVLFPNGSRYINNGSVTVTLYHHSSGNASHDVYIDYIALIGRDAS